jgi:hypothetical protein
MTAGGFEIGSDLDAHATQVDGVTDSLRQAVDAANQVSMPTDAYGILCQPFRMLLDPVEQYGIDALTKAVTAIESVAESVRTSAKSYQAVEDDVTAAMKPGGQ